MDSGTVFRREDVAATTIGVGPEIAGRCGTPRPGRNKHAPRRYCALAAQSPFESEP